MRQHLFLLAILLTCGIYAQAEQRYPVTGMVISVDPAHKSFTVSCKSIPGFMEAMVMPFEVHDENMLRSLKPSEVVDFTLVVERDDSYAEDIRVRNYQNFEQEPMAASRLKLIDRISGNEQAHIATVGEQAPDFSLVDQNRQSIRLSQFRGKVVAVTFIYTSCPLPNYCFRLSNNFGRLHSRFKDRMDNDLVLFSITFDPLHDQPEVLVKYSENWKGDKKGWHFLTGSLADIQTLSHALGLNFWQDEGTVTHSLHTFIIDRHGKLAANLEGNEFTSQQLGDLVEGLINHEN